MTKSLLNLIHHLITSMKSAGVEQNSIHKIPTARELRKSTLALVDRDFIIQKTLARIDAAKEKGEFEINFHATSSEWDVLKQTFDPLGYHCWGHINGKTISWRKYG